MELPLEDRILLVTAYWRTNLTFRQVAPLFGVSKSTANRTIDHLGPKLALKPRKRFAKDTVLIVDGTLVPTRDHAVAEQSKNRLLDQPPGRHRRRHSSRRRGRPAGRCPETATTAGHGRTPARRKPSARRRPSRTAAIPAPGW